MFVELEKVAPLCLSSSSYALSLTAELNGTKHNAHFWDGA